jgi:AcrR family transcriptional regulator
MQSRSAETRSQILDAALKRFANHGYDAASVDDICAEAGVSKGAFYHHFPNKQAVFLSLFEGWLSTVDAGLDAARRESVPESIRAMTGTLPGIFAAADGRLPMFLEFWRVASRDETIWQATVAPYRRYQRYFADLVRQGCAEGSFRPNTDAEAAGQAIVALAVGILLQAALDPRGADWQTTTQESLDILLRGLA